MQEWSLCSDRRARGQGIGREIIQRGSIEAGFTRLTQLKSLDVLPASSRCPFPLPLLPRFSPRAREKSASLYVQCALRTRFEEREREKKKGIELIFREILIDIFVGIKYIIFRETKRSSRERDSKVFFNRICFERKKENVRDKKILLLFFKGEFREGKKKKIIFISFRYRNNSSRMY